MSFDTTDYPNVRVFDKHIEIDVEFVDKLHSGWDTYYSLIDGNKDSASNPIMIFCGDITNSIFNIAPEVGDRYTVSVGSRTWELRRPYNTFYLLGDCRIVRVDGDVNEEEEDGSTMTATIIDITWAFDKILRLSSVIRKGDAFFATMERIPITQDQ